MFADKLSCASSPLQRVRWTVTTLLTYALQFIINLELLIAHPAELKKAGVIGALEEILRCPNDPIDPDDHVIHPAVPLETATAEHFVTFLLVNRLQLTFDEVNRGTILLELDSYIHISNSKPPAIGPFAPIVDTILEEHDHNQGEYLFTLSELTKLIEHLETNYAVDMSEQLAVYDAVFRLFVDSVAIRDTGVYICSKAIITRAMSMPALSLPPLFYQKD
jgi:hypothetical protein